VKGGRRNNSGYFDAVITGTYFCSDCSRMREAISVPLSAAIDADGNGSCTGDGTERGAGGKGGVVGEFVSPNVEAAGDDGSCTVGCSAEAAIDGETSEDRAFSRSSCLLILIPYSIF
jgi:hypothetical protein